MDVRDIGARYGKDRQRAEEARRKYPLHAIAIPVQFPFLISLAMSEIQQDADGRAILRQRSVPLGEGFFPRPVDSWKMREEFLLLKQTDDELRRFLDKYGWWDPTRPLIPVEELWVFRETLMQVLCWPEKARGKQLSPTGFQGLPGLFAARLQATFEYSDGSPKFVVITSGCADAMIATLQCDLARGKEFRKCARIGCDVIFPITNKHDKEYHDRDCQHAALVQHRREEQRKKKAEIRATRERSK
jgi:hypothetical protein